MKSIDLKSSPPDDDAELARLVQYAAAKDPIPPADRAVIEAAARVAWQRMLATRRKSRWRQGLGWLAAAAGLAIALLIFSRSDTTENEEPSQVAVLSLVQGTLLVDTKPALAGQGIMTGAWLETGASRALLELGLGGSARLDHQTRLRFAAPDRLELTRGTLYLEVASKTPLEVMTPWGNVRDIGTRFEVRTGDHLSVRVRDGLVEVRRGQKIRRAAAGREIIVDGGGNFTEGESPNWGETWAWTLELLPSFEVEGRSLREFLEWTAAEGGWQLKFADPATENLAGKVTLHGSVAGLELGQALDLYVQGSNLKYQLADGELRVLP